MQIAVLGASGGIGRWVVELGAERGHQITAVVRESSSWTAPQGVVVVRGEVTDPTLIAGLDLTGQTVISCLGQRRAHLFPWSKLLSPPDLVQTVVRNLLPTNPERLILVSAGGVGDSRDQVRFPVSTLIRAGRIGTAYDDLEAAEARLASAPFPTLAVRPVTLTDGTGEQRVGAIPVYTATSTIHRRSVARWMLDLAEGRVRCDEAAVLLGQTG